MLGDVAVGKTSILTRYVDNEFKSAYNCTIGVEYKIKKIKIDKITEAELKIWDTCGSEKYRTITRQYYLDTQGVVLVFDLTNRETFEKVNVWLNDLKENVPTDYCVILVGNKSDIKERDILLSDEARKFAIRNKMAYIEVKHNPFYFYFVNIDEITEEGIDDEEIFVNFGTSISPCIIRPVDEDGDYTYMILPIKLKD